MGDCHDHTTTLHCMSALVVCIMAACTLKLNSRHRGNATVLIVVKISPFWCSFAFGLVESNLWNREQLQALKATVKQTATAAITWLNSKQAMQPLAQDYTAFTRRARVLMEAGYKKFSAMIQQVCMHAACPSACCMHAFT